MIRKTLSKSLHTLGHGFEWSSTQCHKLGDKALNLPKWMDLKTEEMVQAIKDWDRRQEEAFNLRMEREVHERKMAQEVAEAFHRAVQEVADATAEDVVQKVNVTVV
jgi:hypothetical protein